MNFEKFIKLMMMTTTSSDGECLNAIRMANAELASANKNWEEVLRGKVHVSSSSQTKRPTDGSVHTGPEIDALFELALQNVPEYSSFRKFVESVHSWWETNGYLSQAQYDAIRKAARK